MSIRVELVDLAEAVRARGPGYLMTAGNEGRPHTIHVSFTIEGTELRAPSGRSTGRNIEANPKVALLWPPASPDDYSLIVDGDATVETDGDHSVAVITATSAILHRPAAS